MKLAPLRRREAALPGITGVARVDRRTPRLAGRLHPGDIAVIDHVDLDRISAEALVAARPAAILNAQPSVSGRYPNLGPEVIVSAGIPLLDGVGADIFAYVKEGTRIRVEDGEIFVGDQVVATGCVQTIENIADAMVAATGGMATQLEAFAVNTSNLLHRERDLFIEGLGIPPLRTAVRGRHVVVVVRGFDHADELKSLKHYIREFKPVLIGVDGGADAMLDAGHKPHVIVGQMDAVSDTALMSGAEVVVHATADGRAPGLLRVQDLGVDATVFPSSASSEDVALLLVDAAGAQVVVTVGTASGLAQFLDRGRQGMASSMLTRLRVGAKVIDAKSVAQLHHSRVSTAALLTLVLAMLLAVVVALAAADTGHHYLTSLGATADRAWRYVQELFS